MAAGTAVIDDRNGALRAAAWLAVPLVTAVAVAGVRPVWDEWPLTGTAAIVTSSAWAANAALVAGEPGRLAAAAAFFLVGLGWAGEWLDNLNRGPYPFLAYMSSPVYLTCGAIALLGYTAGRRLGSAERVAAACIGCWLIVGRLGMAVTSAPARFDYPDRVWWPVLTTADSLYRATSAAYWTGAAVVAIVFLALILRIVRNAAHLDRWLLAPLVVALTVTVGTIAVRIPWRLVAPSATTPDALVTAQTLGMLVVPVGFLVSGIRRRLAPASVADLVVRLARRVTGEQLRDALRATLRDPTLDVYYVVPGTDRHVDADGRPAELAAAARGRTVFEVASGDGVPLAAVAASPTLAAHRQLLDSALSAGRLALENARLVAVAAAQLDEIRSARRELVEAGDVARRRIERDLHDGAQQRLAALTLRLAAGAANQADPVLRELLDRARDELRLSLQELRDLAHGTYPAALTDGGLRPAVTDLVERLPLPVRVDIPAGRWPPAVEVTAYFVISEALTNTVKHADATAATVRVAEHGARFQVVVTDDGRGGADAGAGTGLRGLRHRVASLGGELTVDGGNDGGTVVSVAIPRTGAGAP